MSVPQFHLRPAIAADLDAVLALERATSLAPHWPPSAYAAHPRRVPHSFRVRCGMGETD